MLQISMALCAVHHRSNRNGPIGSMKQGYQLPGSYSFIEPMKALTVQALSSVRRWSITPSMCSSWKEPICASNRSPKSTSSVLADLYAGLQKLERATCPFVNLPEKKRGRWSQGITPAIMKRCHWVEPVLVAQVKFTEWTQDDQLRQPVFLGLRTDKQAKDVVRE